MSYKTITQQQYAAYNLAHQTTENKTQQIVMLFDGMLRHVNLAKQAINENNIQERYNSLEKVSKILMGLQASLDFDSGGDLAAVLDRYYDTIFTKVHAINRENTIESCDDMIEELKVMRQVWQSVHEEISAHPDEGKKFRPQADTSLQVSV